MKLELIRNIFTAKATLGSLSIDGRFFAYTLEDVVRAVKIPKETAIPYGKYKVVVTMSNRFKRNLPLLLDVPGFSGVRFHSGNTEEDTEGCILIGLSRDGAQLRESRRASDALTARMEAALASGEDIELTIIQGGNFREEIPT